MFLNSKVTIKNDEEIALMRESGRLLSIVFKELEAYVRPGISTKEIDTFAEKTIRGLGGVPNFLNYEGFPGSVCTSVNDQVVHGIPSEYEILDEGDIISLDCGLIYKGYHSDAARTYGVGKISKEAKELIDVTRRSFFAGIEKAVAGNRLYDISRAIDDYIVPHGYGIVRELTGHGIGKNLHEEPMIPNYKKLFERGIKLKAGMTLAIEPMITYGSRRVVWAEDEWTVITEDGSLAAHYENTILVTEGRPEILTLYKE